MKRFLHIFWLRFLKRLGWSTVAQNRSLGQLTRRPAAVTVVAVAQQESA